MTKRNQIDIISIWFRLAIHTMNAMVIYIVRSLPPVFRHILEFLFLKYQMNHLFFDVHKLKDKMGVL